MRGCVLEIVCLIYIFREEVDAKSSWYITEQSYAWLGLFVELGIALLASHLSISERILWAPRAKGQAYTF